MFSPGNEVQRRVDDELGQAIQPFRVRPGPQCASGIHRRRVASCRVLPQSAPDSAIPGRSPERWLDHPQGPRRRASEVRAAGIKVPSDGALRATWLDPTIGRRPPRVGLAAPERTGRSVAPQLPHALILAAPSRVGRAALERTGRSLPRQPATRAHPCHGRTPRGRRCGGSGRRNQVASASRSRPPGAAGASARRRVLRHGAPSRPGSVLATHTAPRLPCTPGTAAPGGKSALHCCPRPPPHQTRRSSAIRGARGAPDSQPRRWTTRAGSAPRPAGASRAARPAWGYGRPRCTHLGL